MMMNNMKAYELNEMEMYEVAGGHSHDAIRTAEKVYEMMKEQKTEGPALVETISDAASTAWEVVKYAFDLFG